MHADIHAVRACAALASAQRAWDNLAEPEPTEADAIREQIRLAEEYIGRAERALQAGDNDAACDLLSCAMRELGEVAGAPQ